MNTVKITPPELLGKQKPAVGKHNIPLRDAAADALHAMIQAARKEKLNILCVSGYRSFDDQKSIWNRKFQSYIKKKISPDQAVREIIRYSAIPGTSRHHWGTDVDIILDKAPRPADPLLAEHFAPGGLYADLDVWMRENAAAYGFQEVYTRNPQRPGFTFEPWHWSYTELSLGYLETYLSLDLHSLLRDKAVDGSDQFDTEFVEAYIQKWVLGINPRLIPSTG